MVRCPLTRLTPEVAFPEAEGWPATYFANPYPLSEQPLSGGLEFVAAAARHSASALGHAGTAE